ncbi:hypothetical protein [Edaphobacter albus]|uniref:hypothetical protein n=1 Tax=Edaphobacter sp. 4G125 TaxID=2763071 RepID=UPI0016468F42|nr:hypothetical protein [Edaphobacter sp. 4G125]QNI36854.1 hypothetical protein H7846_00460 [Edaphobacter sp. 4G125]
MRRIGLLILAVSTLTAAAADPCATAKKTLTTAEKKMYARSISSNLTQWQPPTKIRIDRAITVGSWTAVWATPSGAEQGVFFYSQNASGLKFHDVWGGYATPDEKPSIVQWVKKLDSSVPNSFAECFAEIATASH